MTASSRIGLPMESSRTKREETSRSNLSTLTASVDCVPAVVPQPMMRRFIE